MTSRPIPLLLVALLLLSSLAPLASAGEVWTKETGSAITAVATDERGDLIFVGTESGMLYCYNSAGSEVWSAQVPHPDGNRPIGALDVGGDRLMVSTLGVPGRVEVRMSPQEPYIGITNQGPGALLDGWRYRRRKKLVATYGRGKLLIYGMPTGTVSFVQQAHTPTYASPERGIGGASRAGPR